MKISLQLAILMITTGASAQEVTKKTARFSYGITLSPTVSKVKYLNDDFSQIENTPKIGIGAGATVKYDFSEKWFVLSGITYKKISSEMKVPLFGSSSGIVSDLGFTLLEIPIQLNYKINLNRNEQLFVGLGISASKFLKATSRLTESYGINTIDIIGNEISTINSFNDLNMSGCFAAGVEFPLKYSDTLLLSLSVDRNLLEMTKPREQPNPSGLFDYGYRVAQQRLTNFSLNVTYLLH